MKQQNRQLGISTAKAVMVVVMAILVVIIGWQIYTAQTNNQDATTPNNQTTSVDDTEVTYKNEEFGYSFEYPKEWRTSDAANETGATPGQPKLASITVESPDMTISNEGVGFQFTKGARMWVKVEQAGAPTPMQVIETNPFLNMTAQNREATTLAGLPAVRFSQEYESSPTLTTLAVKGDKQYEVIFEYADQVSLDQYKDEYEALVDSFTFE